MPIEIGMTAKSVGWSMVIALLATGTNVLHAQVFTKSKPQPSSGATPSPSPSARPVEPRRTIQPAPRPRQSQVRTTAPSPPPLPQFVGAIPRTLTGKWAATAQSGALQSTYLIGIEIDGGNVGEVIGKVTYWLMSEGREPSFTCVGALTLTSAENGTFVVDERVGSKGIFCPGDKSIKMQVSNDKLYVEWSRKNRDHKVTMQGWASKVKPET